MKIDLPGDIFHKPSFRSSGYVEFIIYILKSVRIDQTIWNYITILSVPFRIGLENFFAGRREARGRVDFRK